MLVVAQSHYISHYLLCKVGNDLACKHFSIYFAHVGSVVSPWSTIAYRRLFQKETSWKVSYVIWNLFTIGSLQFFSDSTIASLEANQNWANQNRVLIVFLPCFLKLSDFLALLKTDDLPLGERLLTKVDRIFTFIGVDFGSDCLALAIPLPIAYFHTDAYGMWVLESDSESF